jgi:hypothetical protein
LSLNNNDDITKVLILLFLWIYIFLIQADDDFGKEFLGSWKSMSMADDDAMDFSFDTVSKSKKKTFNFDKM